MVRAAVLAFALVPFLFLVACDSSNVGKTEPPHSSPERMTAAPTQLDASSLQATFPKVERLSRYLTNSWQVRVRIDCGVATSYAVGYGARTPLLTSFQPCPSASFESEIPAGSMQPLAPHGTYSIGFYFRKDEEILGPLWVELKYGNSLVIHDVLAEVPGGLTKTRDGEPFSWKELSNGNVVFLAPQYTDSDGSLHDRLTLLDTSKATTQVIDGPWPSTDYRRLSFGGHKQGILELLANGNILAGPTVRYSALYDGATMKKIRQFEFLVRDSRANVVSTREGALPLSGGNFVLYDFSETEAPRNPDPVTPWLIRAFALMDGKTGEIIMRVTSPTGLKEIVSSGNNFAVLACPSADLPSGECPEPYRVAVYEGDKGKQLASQPTPFVATVTSHSLNFLDTTDRGDFFVFAGEQSASNPGPAAVLINGSSGSLIASIPSSSGHPIWTASQVALEGDNTLLEITYNTKDDHGKKSDLLLIEKKSGRVLKSIEYNRPSQELKVLSNGNFLLMAKFDEPSHILYSGRDGLELARYEMLRYPNRIPDSPERLSGGNFLVPDAKSGVSSDGSYKTLLVDGQSGRVIREIAMKSTPYIDPVLSSDASWKKHFLLSCGEGQGDICILEQSTGVLVGYAVPSKYRPKIFGALPDKSSFLVCYAGSCSRYNDSGARAVGDFGVAFAPSTLFPFTVFPKSGTFLRMEMERGTQMPHLVTFGSLSPL